MTKFPFNDFHSFKDFVVFVQICSANKFSQRQGALADTPWTLNLAFEGLRQGLRMAVKEKGERPAFAESRRLVEEAYDAYKFGDIRSGFMKLEQVQKLLQKIPSQ
ncbi:MAG TPA: hypothetical protein VMF32_26315 [Xanthobacteraceae bacterium]|nr:hypothetical protein [Xanthobacteraceae bacterium]